jgi:predicted RNA binding protein YcfA (HicA-like mRNA interferase family)
MLCRVVEQHGWVLLRIRGSHHIYGKPDERIILTIPVHGNRALPTGLLRYLLKQAGLTDRDL